jgi:hypothetical protein
LQLERRQHGRAVECLEHLELAPDALDLGDARLLRARQLREATGLLDPWGRPYVYRQPGRNAAAEVFTLGRDNAPGGQGEDQDLTSW